MFVVSRPAPTILVTKYCRAWFLVLILQSLKSVHNPGANVDSNLSMQTHVAKVMQTCFFRLKHLCQILQLLSGDVSANITAFQSQCSARQSTIFDPCTAAARLQCCHAAVMQSSTEGPCHRCHHRVALAADLPVDIATAVSAPPLITKRPVTKLRCQAQVTRHSSLQSANKNDLLVQRTTIKLTCCCTRSLQQLPITHQQHSSF